MQLKEFSVTLGKLIHDFQFEVIHGPENFENIEISTDDVNRPGLQLAGFFDYFEPNRLQVMGKVRSRMTISVDMPRDEVIAAAKADEKIAELIAGKTIRKEIYVPGKLVNIVAN